MPLEIRRADGAIDQIIANPAEIHLEQTDFDCWSLSVDDRHFIIISNDAIEVIEQ